MSKRLLERKFVRKTRLTSGKLEGIIDRGNLILLLIPYILWGLLFGSWGVISHQQHHAVLLVVGDRTNNSHLSHNQFLHLITSWLFCRGKLWPFLLKAYLDIMIDPLTQVCEICADPDPQTTFQECHQSCSRMRSRNLSRMLTKSVSNLLSNNRWRDIHSIYPTQLNQEKGRISLTSFQFC